MIAAEVRETRTVVASFKARRVGTLRELLTVKVTAEAIVVANEARENHRDPV